MILVVIVSIRPCFIQGAKVRNKSDIHHISIQNIPNIWLFRKQFVILRSKTLKMMKRYRYPVTIEQGGNDRIFNSVKLKYSNGQVLFGGKATVRIEGDYLL